MKTRKTKQSQIDTLQRIVDASTNRISELKAEFAAKEKQLKEQADKANQYEYHARVDITNALGIEIENPCNRALNWPQIYVELGKLIQIKELYYPKKEKASYPTAC